MDDHVNNTSVAQNGKAPAWEEVRHVLEFPAEGPNGQVTEVVLREPDIDGLEKIDDLGLTEGAPIKVSQIRAIIAILSGLPDETVKKFYKRDFAAVGEKLLPLLAEPTIPTAG